MLIQIILFLLAGIFAGTITGLIPGIHINLVGFILVSLSVTIFSSLNPIYLIVFIVAMAITHTFVDFIPSIFLGCPDTDTELSVLPGHDLLNKGLGYEAVLLTCYGGLAAVFILILISYPSVLFVKVIYNFIKTWMAYILLGILGVMIFTEKKKFSAFFVFALSGLLGLCVLNINLKEPLLPLLSGLFGSSMLLLSIKDKIQIPPQKITKPKIKLKRPILAALISSPICGFLPGLGSGQAAVVGNTILKTDEKGFLVLLGATNTLVMGISFLSLYTIYKTRTGAAAAVQEIIGNLEINTLILILGVVLISGVISFFLTKYLARIISKKITSIKYKTISIITLTILCLVVFLVSGFLGILVLVASTFTGIYCISLGVRRTHMMGCLLLPTIIFYLGM